MSFSKQWTDAEIAYLEKHYPDQKGIDVADHLGRPLHQIYKQAQRMGLSKSAAFKQKYCKDKVIAVGKNTRFKKGQKAWNEGISYDAGGRSVETRFKKGMTPANALHDGAITIRTQKNGKKHAYIRLAPGKWEPMHRHIWKKKVGSIPKGYMVRHISDDTLDNTIYNLMLISFSENARENHNPQKMKATMAQKRAEGYKSPAERLSDKFIAHFICGGDPELKEIILNRPEIIQIARLNYQLKREIRNAE